MDGCSSFVITYMYIYKEQYILLHEAHYLYTKEQLTYLSFLDTKCKYILVDRNYIEFCPLMDFYAFTMITNINYMYSQQREKSNPNRGTKKRNGASYSSIATQTFFSYFSLPCTEKNDYMCHFVKYTNNVT